MARRLPEVHHVRRHTPQRLLPLALMGLALCLSACGPRNAASRTDAPLTLTLTTEDGVSLPATFYPAGPESVCGVVLVHDKGGTGAQWAPFAKRLQQSGIASIAFDLRGHGAGADEPRSHREFTPSDWLRAGFDIQAAVQALAAHGVDPDNIGIAGAGMGATLATHYAAQDETIEALVLISPALESDGVAIRRAFEAYTQRPSLLVAARGDTYAASSAQTLKRAASTFCELREYAGGAHGIHLLDALVGAREEVVYWLESILKTSQDPAEQGDDTG